MNLLIAKVLKPQGIRGEVKCQLYTDVLEAIKVAKRVFIDDNICEIEKSSVRGGFWYVKFLGINDRNNAEIFRGCNIFLPKEEIESFKNADFLVGDLIGMVVYDENGTLVGQIVDYEDYGSAAILSIEENGHIFEVPYIREVFSTDKNTLVVNRKAYEDNKI